MTAEEIPGSEDPEQEFPKGAHFLPLFEKIPLGRERTTRPEGTINNNGRDVFCRISAGIPGFPPHIVTPILAVHS